MDEERNCVDCIHYHACGMWAVGTLEHTRANGCANFETVKSSFAYGVGYYAGRREALIERERIRRKNESLESQQD